MEDFDIPELKAQVIITCTNEYMNVDKVEFEDIHEDISGRDIMTFKCPKCGESHESLIWG